VPTGTAVVVVREKERATKLAPAPRRRELACASATRTVSEVAARGAAAAAMIGIGLGVDAERTTHDGWRITRRSADPSDTGLACCARATAETAVSGVGLRVHAAPIAEDLRGNTHAISECAISVRRTDVAARTAVFLRDAEIPASGAPRAPRRAHHALTDAGVAHLAIGARRPARAAVVAIRVGVDAGAPAVRLTGRAGRGANAAAADLARVADRAAPTTVAPVVARVDAAGGTLGLPGRTTTHPTTAHESGRTSRTAGAAVRLVGLEVDANPAALGPHAAVRDPDVRVGHTTVDSTDTHASPVADSGGARIRGSFELELDHDGIDLVAWQDDVGRSRRDPLTSSVSCPRAQAIRARRQHGRCHRSGIRSEEGRVELFTPRTGAARDPSLDQDGVAHHAGARPELPLCVPWAGLASEEHGDGQNDETPSHAAIIHRSNVREIQADPNQVGQSVTWLHLIDE
jgi:hypothetical protein